MKIFYNSWVAKLFTFLPDFETIMLFGMTFTEGNHLSDKSIKHETTHMYQYWGCFIIGIFISLMISIAREFSVGLIFIPILLYYILYVYGYIIRFLLNFILFKVMKKKVTFMELSDSAYYGLAFEREAYESETSDEKVGLFTFLRYIKFGIII